MHRKTAYFFADETQLSSFFYQFFNGNFFDCDVEHIIFIDQFIVLLCFLDKIVVLQLQQLDKIKEQNFL
jgi:hypothetical protein